MSTADIIILAICGISMLVSLFRGFVKEAFSLVVWFLAVYAGLLAAEPFSERLTPWVEVPSVRVIIAFVGVFVTVLVVGGLVNYLLGKLVASTGLSGTDRLVGALFGALRGAAIVLVAVIIARFTPFPEDPWWQKSRLLPEFERLAVLAVQYFPETVQEHIPPDSVAEET
ncbi:MAG: CvpA family protein [Wenzhouxiangella sp.]|jgi:membrane protein required for colicin V production|nr:CvpA family protein [Wenzhouxiangella sp.]